MHKFSHIKFSLSEQLFALELFLLSHVLSIYLLETTVISLLDILAKQVRLIAKGVSNTVAQSSHVTFHRTYLITAFFDRRLLARLKSSMPTYGNIISPSKQLERSSENPIVRLFMSNPFFDGYQKQLGSTHIVKKVIKGLRALDVLSPLHIGRSLDVFTIQRQPLASPCPAKPT